MKRREKEGAFVFGPKNYRYMLIGLALIALGYLLMSGGGSRDPNVFNEAIFSFRRIRLAPFLGLAGFGVEIYAIMSDPKRGR